MTAFEIQGMKNEIFTIGAIEETDQLPHLHASLLGAGFDGKIYTMNRVVTGRKKPHSIQCYKRGNSFTPMV